MAINSSMQFKLTIWRSKSWYFVLHVANSISDLLPWISNHSARHKINHNYNLAKKRLKANRDPRCPILFMKSG